MGTFIQQNRFSISRRLDGSTKKGSQSRPGKIGTQSTSANANRTITKEKFKRENKLDTFGTLRCRDGCVLFQ
jgi:hypothetical protein